MARKFRLGSFGTVISGTMRSQDVIPALTWELRHLGHRSTKLTLIEKRYEKAIEGEFGEDDEYFTSETAMYDLENLFDMMQEHAPEFAYFGANEGDGSDYGFWISSNFAYEFDGLKVEDTSKIPSNYVGEVLHVNDHGNMTLYFKSARKLKEIWAVV